MAQIFSGTEEGVEEKAGQRSEEGLDFKATLREVQALGTFWNHNSVFHSNMYRIIISVGRLLSL